MISGMVTSLAGLVSSRLLFWRFPTLDWDLSPADASQVSVIIPARNEENVIRDLLDDLNRQISQPLEILCVDDESTDDTAAVASAHGARVISAPIRPDGWLGKSWACETGWLAARGAHILFLDADVRLHPNALSAMMAAYEAGDSPISVQPYHSVPAEYEQLALFFNALQFGANGAALPRDAGVGLFGPAILIRRTTLEAIGGFLRVRSCVVEDLALGYQLRRDGFGFRLFAGGSVVSFRMYRDGFHAMVEGWTKNFAAGAARTPTWLFALVFIWVMGCTSTPLRLAMSLADAHWLEGAFHAVAYAVWIFELKRIANRLGSFRTLTIMGYPVALSVFLWVFIRSFLKKTLGIPVRWKGREIRWGK